MNILGINSVAVDAAASLLSKGKVIAAMEEERFTRIKHDGAFPVNAIESCLSIGKIEASDLDAICFSFDEWKAVRSRLLYFMSRGDVRALWNTICKRGKAFIGQLQHETTFQKKFSITKKTKIYKFDHHLSHAASCFFPSPFDKAAILILDAAGEDTSISIHIGRDNRIQTLKKYPYGQSLGALYTSLTEFLGFKPNSGEGKVMGLAAYGEASFAKQMEQLLTLKPGGEINLDLSYFTHHRGLGSHCSSRFHKEFGLPRIPESQITKRDENLAASLQKKLEDAAIHIARHLKKISGVDQLCLAGGVALNGVMNAAILEHSGFKEVYLMPSPGDSGSSAGAALLHYHHNQNQQREAGLFETPFLGVSFSDEEVETEVKKFPNLRWEKRPDFLEYTAYKLSQGAIVGWFQGRFEFGPRALGARSILADPRRADMKDILNERVKFRESFRPFAPAILYEHRADYFENCHDNPFMLLVFRIREKMRDRIPSGVHIDGTGRGQTVHKEISPTFWELIRKFRDKTGVPVLLNTSFNVRGEPIINSPFEALQCFVKTKIDFLVMGDIVVWKQDEE